MDFISTTNAPKASEVYSQAVKLNNLIFVSGQIGLDPITNTLKDGLEGEVKQSLENLLQVAIAGGGTKQSIVKCTLYLLDMTKFAEINKIYGEFFAGHKPARATVEVSKLPLGASFEIECIAAASL